MDNEEKVREFEAVTGVPSERAKFYLESAAWQLDVALASFYENGGDDEEGNVNDLSDAPAQDESPLVTPPPQTQASPRPKPLTSSRFATVQSLQQSQASSDEEEGQAFYAGGSRNSGQQILGPPKKRDIVADMFKAVQEHATEVLDPQNTASSSSTRLFQGTGYRLGQTPEDTTTVSTPKTESLQPTTVVLKLWREGFTLGDGPMRMYNDPENGEFLDYIKKGEIPPELIKEAHGAEVHVDLEDHRHEQYVAPKTKIAAFSGKGHTLGSPAPNVVSSVAPTTKAPEVDKGNEEAAMSVLNTDENAPSTNIQVRLSDGSRLSGRFNLNHTIADLRRYITIARPQYENTSFSLMTTFPSRELSNLEETVAQAGLLNAAVMQRLNPGTQEPEVPKQGPRVHFNLENKESYWESLGRGFVLGDNIEHKIEQECNCASYFENQEAYWRSIGRGYALNTIIENLEELCSQTSSTTVTQDLVQPAEIIETEAIVEPVSESYWESIGPGYVLGKK